ncbi:MAG TPA: aromatic ring-hydroxylating dioxygenase subunit alpha [Steroidobacteraceae bacterium]|nr:aromatic ring-hydroxylating dioxygenase subunit alpha [Steroidobacteraceae bacterium]
MRTSPRLQQLVREHRRGGSLAQAFYVDKDLFEIEVERFLGSHWLLAGHISQVPHQGDYFVIEALGASVIVVRGTDGEINALHNVCRHRGARICEAVSGRTSLLRCRYHGWSYRLDGELAAWRHMPDGLEKSDHALRRCGVAIFEGLILISLAPADAPDPASMLQHVQAHWARYELANCKVAATREYRIQANWKLGIENNLECYHCLASHPEYTAANAFVRADERISDSVVEAYAAYQQSWQAQMQKTNVITGQSDFLTTKGQACRAGTGALAPGQLTASRDGKAVAPLLGRISAYDESVTTGCVGFLSYLGAMCDYAVAVTYVPQDVGVTQVVMRWLVRSDAVEGRDYDVANLCWLWDETTKQDKSIIELNAAGVASRGYIPGPYSRLEGMTADFIDRYLNLMTDPA